MAKDDKIYIGGRAPLITQFKTVKMHTWQKHPDSVYIDIEVQGGGGGGNRTSTGSNHRTVGAGAGAGGYIKARFYDFPDDSVMVKVGGGGLVADAAASSGAGIDGGGSFIYHNPLGILLNGRGGNGCTVTRTSSAGATIRNADAGSWKSGEAESAFAGLDAIVLVQQNGQWGEYGYKPNESEISLIIGGQGGDSVLGGGGKSHPSVTLGTANDRTFNSTYAPTGYGGGAAGVSYISNQGTKSSTDGGHGIVIITEYF